MGKTRTLPLCFARNVFFCFKTKGKLVSTGAAEQHKCRSDVRVRVSAKDADQTAGRHGPVLRMVGQSEGTSQEPLRDSEHVGDVLFSFFLTFAGEGGQHGEGLPAQETLSKATAHGGHVQAAGRQRRHLQRGEDQQRLQQGEDGLRCEQGTGEVLQLVSLEAF